MSERWTVLSILRTTTGYFEEKSVAEPRLSAEHLLADTLDCRRLDLYLRYDRPLEPSEVEAYRRRVKRRLAGEPVQYITGTTGFRGLDLAVDGRALVPRPETEVLVGEALAWARAEAGRGRRPEGGWRVADVGTGSGAIALAVEAELEDVARVVGLDESPEALALARENAERVGATRTRWVASDLFDGLRAGVRFHAILANPPYVATGDRSTLPSEVAEWEPERALFAGPRGDEVLQRIVDEAAERLSPGGLLALEIGAGQAAAVRERIQGRDGLEFLATFHDHAGIERGVLAIAETDER